MKNRIGGRQFHRNSAERKHLYRNLMVSLIEHEKIKTTDARCKEIQPMIEKLIRLALTDTQHTRSLATSTLANRDAVLKLFGEIAPRYTTRVGGYTRIFKLGFRHGDGAEVSQIELIPA